MELNKNTEIRHLPENIQQQLAQILDEKWKTLMEGIPKELVENNDGNFINNFPKYSPDQINLVEKHCMVQKINLPVLVIFDEWGSSGKIRPTMGHLLKVICNLQHFMAADYICKLLNEPIPIRPMDGPGARVQFTSFLDLPAQNCSNYGDNRNNANDNKGYSNQNKVQLPLNLKSFGSSISVKNSDQQVKNIPEEPQGEPIISYDGRPNFTGLLKESTDLPPFPNLSAFQTSDSRDSNHNIITSNGYVELENIKFSDIQSATDNFKDCRKLGEGGFSTVYLATNLRPAFEYSAIKRLHMNYAKSSEHFFREIELLKNVEHQNIIKLLGYSSHPDEMCFVYEYVNGKNLYEKLENCRIDKDHLHWKDRIYIAHGCSDGIKYLHSNLVNIIHRDIKSSNILLDGITPKICDFGFVKNANFNTATIAVGTNPYMAPETVRGNVSIAVDVFAFGVVILELVSGFKVLDDSNPNEVIDLVTYFETSLKQLDYHIAFTDKKAGDWKHLDYTKTAAEEMLEIARKCLLSRSDRLEIIDVNLGLTKIYNDYCT